VTGVFNEKTKLESSVAITSLRPSMIQQRLPRGTGDLLNAVPGTYVDNAGGEVGTRIYARGMASGTVDDTGFRYVSLQEDGLPIMSSLVQFASADMFSRVDINIDRLEAIRGGSSAVTAPNSPGGVYNFISKEGGREFAGTAILRSGINGRDNLYTRADLGIGGPLSDNGWTYYLGGFYRYDEGARDLPFVANQGGQLKANLVKNYDSGRLKFYGKFLDDRVTHYRPLPFKDFQSLDPFEGALQPFDLNYSSTFSDVRAYLPDYSYGKGPGAQRDFDSRTGIDIEHYAIGALLEQELGEWDVTANVKYSYANQRYLQFVGNVVVPTEFAMAGLGYTPDAGFDPNGFRFYDAKTNELLYSLPDQVNKMGDNVFATFPLDMHNQIDDLMGKFTISRQAGKHQLLLGAFLSTSTLRSTWHADILFGTLEPNSRPVRVAYPNFVGFIPGQPANLQITDPNGFIALNAATLLSFEGTSNTTSVFFNDVWQASDRLSLDLGLRYERIAQHGFKRGWETPSSIRTFQITPNFAVRLPNGFDNNYTTMYDVTARRHTEAKFEYDEAYDMLAFSLGANLKLSDRQAVFARFSKGNKAPDHEWYISNFENVPITRGVVEKVYQGEVGLKTGGKHYSLFLTGFYSYLDDIPYQAFIVSSNTTFFTPVTFNTARTMGLELEANISPAKGLNFRVLGTLQDPRYVQFALYNTNGTSPRIRGGEIQRPLLPAGTPITFPETPPTPQPTSFESDDYYEDMSGNQVNEVPKVIVDVTGSYDRGKFGVFLNARYTGKYQYNKRNDFQMPDYWVINGGLSFAASQRVQFALQVNNLFNAIGVTRTEGAALLDGNKEFFTKEFFEQHTQSVMGTGRPGSVWAVPILPRLSTISVTYNF
jgi:outer membrane receptor protein involved in Fe transport